MNIVFFGSDDFAVSCLEPLLRSQHKILACITQQDKTKGRHLKLGVSPVKEFVVQNGITVLQPVSLADRSFIEKLKSYQSDVFVVVAYGRILSAEILAIPKIFSVNVHASLLPKYRGAAPINWAIINDEASTGISIIKMNPMMDAGEIIFQKEVPIDKDETSVMLRAKLAIIGGPCLLKVLDAIEKKNYTLTAQDPEKVTLAPKLTKEHGLIRWQEPAVRIHGLIKGLLPWPGAFTYYSGRLLKILEADVVESGPGKFSPGEVAEITPEGITVITGKGVLRLRQVHLESSKPMDAKSFLIGHKLGIGSHFG